MKRSEINNILQESKDFFNVFGFKLPKYSLFTLDDWKKANLSVMKEILEGNLGWDVTDFNQGNFKKIGLTLFSLRNKSLENHKPYAEKVLIIRENQLTPLHYHWHKMEDIVNRGGGILTLQLYNRDPKTDLLDTTSRVSVSIDGEIKIIPAGTKIKLEEGQSICLTPLLYHCFWAEKGNVLASEISMANDDLHDNRFLESITRYSNIEEDELPSHLLCSDYKTFLSTILSTTLIDTE